MPSNRLVGDRLVLNQTVTYSSCLSVPPYCVLVLDDMPLSESTIDSTDESTALKLAKELNDAAAAGKSLEVCKLFLR